MSDLRWSGPIAFEGQDTIDGRHIQPGAINWPVTPLRLARVSDDEDDPGRWVGSIESVERRGAQIYGTGRYTGDWHEPGDRVGIAIDLEVQPEDMEYLDETLVVKAAQLRGADIDTTPAWPEAVITIEARA